jgi:hypothetical protein
MRKKPKLYYFEWCDAQGLVNGWHDREYVSRWSKTDNWVIYQAGYLIDETKEYIVIATQYNPQLETEDQFAEILKIPKTWIRRRRRVTISF